MAQNVETPETVSVASGATDVFATVWTFERTEDVTVSVEIGGVTAEAEQGVAYQILPGDWLSDGADLVFQPGHRPPAGARVIRRRETTVEQVQPLGDLATFRPLLNEAAFDRLTRMLQEERTRGSRGVMSPVGEAGLVLPVQAVRADRFLTFDGNGDLRTVEKPTDFDGLNKVNRNGDNLSGDEPVELRGALGVVRNFVGDLGATAAAFTAALGLGSVVHAQAGAYDIGAAFAVPAGKTLIMEPGATWSGAGVLSPFLDAGARVELWNGGANAKGYYNGVKIAGAWDPGIGPFESYTGPFMFDVRSDRATLTDIWSVDPFIVHFRSRGIVDGPISGGRIQATFGLSIRATPLFEAGVERAYQSLQTALDLDANLGGTALAPKGSIYANGDALYMTAAATHLYEVAVDEKNLFTVPGGSSKYLRMLSLAGRSAWHGSQVDAAMTVSAINSAGVYHVGWDHIFLITDANSADPTYANSTILGFKWFINPAAKRSIKAVMDVSGVECSAGIIFGSHMELSESNLLLGDATGTVNLGAASNGVMNLDSNAHTVLSVFGVAGGTKGWLLVGPGGADPVYLSTQTGDFIVRMSGGRFDIDLPSQATVGAAGGASALPSAPAKYFLITDGAGGEYAVPAYLKV